jgi:RNA recognition motif-containing protein
MTGMQCKKCGGKHLTIKCWRQSTNTFNDKKQNCSKDIINSPRNFRKNNGEKYCVRISNIPTDLNIRELNDLMQEWGDIGKINFNNSIEYKAAFVDFYIKEEAEYFVKALDRTNFDNLILRVELLDKFK